jgi:DNA ligase-1
MLLNELVQASASVRNTRSKKRKTAVLAELLSHVSAAEAEIAVSFLSGRPRQDRLNLGYAAIRDLTFTPDSTAEPLTLTEVDAVLGEIAGFAGPGSKQQRSDSLAALFARATEDEQRYLRGLIVREVRQGALDGVMTDAVAATIGVEPTEVRRATMLSGDLVVAATAGLTSGRGALAEFHLELLRPVSPMLAQSAETVGAALDRVGPASVEWKLDGIRIQLHREGDEVRVYTRNLNDITARVPEVVTVARTLNAERCILDGEALLVDPQGRPAAFQQSMSGLGGDGDASLSPFFFDCLLLNAAELIDEPLSERRRTLAGISPPEHIVPALETTDRDDAQRFFDEALAVGHEGVVVKGVASPYEAGRRGSGWIKVKPAYTLDLVVLAAEWGSGRRRGWLSNLHLGARDPDSGEFVMLGKTFKGLTDETLQWQTGRFLDLEQRREGHVVYVRPEQVVEIAFDGVQASPRYPGGVALRFARVKRYRPDKDPEEADTIATVRAIRGSPNR